MNGTERVLMHAGLRLLLVGALLGLGGCASEKPPLPKTHVARGKVLHKNGQPMTSGGIEFRSVNDPSAPTTTGQIQPDGTFILQSLFDRDTAAGAVPGEYRVTIIPALVGDQTKQAPLHPIVLPDTYTIKPDTDNEFSITVPDP
jgi:hypothetical protein